MIILDIKSGSEVKYSHILQLAGYKILIEENLSRINKGFQRDIKVGPDDFYVWQKKKYARVTNTIDIYTSSWVKDNIHSQEYYANRGKWVHRITQLIDRGISYEIGEDEEDIKRGYIRAWFEFRNEYKNVINIDSPLIEVSLLSDKHGIGGQVDRIYNFHEKDDIVCWNVYLDHKKGDFKVKERTIDKVTEQVFLNTVYNYNWFQNLKNKNKE